MKSSKILALALAALTMTACSDDDNDFSYNTNGDVTVEMAETNVEVMENTGIFTVPIKLTGERNGYVRVTVECVETGADPAIANRHYYLTTDVINIAADDESSQIEFATVDFRGLDPNRTFNVSIASAEGATIGANKTTTVQIDDKGSAPLYADLSGKWFFSTNSVDFKTSEFNIPVFVQVSLSANQSDGEGGGDVNLTGIPFNGYNFSMVLTYDYDQEEKYGELVFNYGTEALSGSEVLWVNSGGSTDVKPVRGRWNFDYTSVTFGNESTVFGIGVFQDGSYQGLFNAFNAFTLTKIND